MMSYSYFGCFDPMSAKPVTNELLLENIFRRAKQLLINRTDEQISNAASSIEWAVDQYFCDEEDRFVQHAEQHGSWILHYLPEESRDEAGIRYLLANWPSEADDPRPNVPNAENCSMLEALKECFYSYISPDDPEFPDGQEDEYFAVLALVHASIASIALRNNTSHTTAALKAHLGYLDEPTTTIPYPWEHANLLLSAGRSAVSAMETVCYAEMLRFSATQVEVIESLQAKVNAEKSLVCKAVQNEVSKRAKHAADCRHGKAGGSAEKRLEIRAIWATGKYSSRDLCAEEEYQALGMSFSTARKALRQTPDPCRT